MANRFRRSGRVRVHGREVVLAGNLATRLLGLALLSADRAGEGLLIPRCGSVHTFGMRFALDIYFLDGDGRPTSVRRAVPPNRVVSDPAAVAVLEVPSRTGSAGGEPEGPPT